MKWAQAIWSGRKCNGLNMEISPRDSWYECLVPSWCCFGYLWKLLEVGSSLRKYINVIRCLGVTWLLAHVSSLLPLFWPNRTGPDTYACHHDIFPKQPFMSPLKSGDKLNHSLCKYYINYFVTETMEVTNTCMVYFWIMKNLKRYCRILISISKFHCFVLLLIINAYKLLPLEVYFPPSGSWPLITHSKFQSPRTHPKFSEWLCYH